LTEEYRPHFDEGMIYPSKLDTAIECLLIALLAFMPLAFGVVHAWSEEIVIAVVGAMTVLFLLRVLILRAPALIWTWAYVPIALFLLIAALQLVPLPARVVGIVSPNTVTLRTELLGDLPGARKLLESMPISLYSNGTKHDLRLVLTVAAVFVIVLNVYRRSDQIKRLLTAIALIGGFIAAVTLAQNLFGNGKIYWFISSPNTKGYSGPFVNHNNYGQFMNLSIGAALVLFMVRVREAFAGRKLTPTVAFECLSWRSSKFLWLLLAIMSIGAATVFVSLTRGGMIGLLTAMVCTTALFASQRSLKGHGWVMVGVGLLAFVCVLYVGFDAVYDRLASLRALGNAGDGRLQILKDIAVAWTLFPALGTGLGTHAVVYPMFDHSSVTALAAYAENEYAQALEETGVVGLGLLIILATIVGSGCLRSIRRGERPIHLAAYGLSFGLVAVLVQSLTDFGQHLPANGILSAVFCALLLSLARPRQDRYRVSLGPSSQRVGCAKSILHTRTSFAVLRPAVFLGVCALWSWVVVGADKARLAEVHWHKAFAMQQSLSARHWQGTDAEYADLIGQATAAVGCQPDNITYRHWLNVYRWRSLCRAIGSNPAQMADRADLKPAIQDIVSELHKSLFVCPTHGPTYSMVGQIEKFILDDDSGADEIRRGFRLAPCDPITCFVAGRLDMLEGKTEDCIAKFERAVQLDGDLFKDVADIYVNQLSRPHLAVSAAGDNIARLSYVVEILEHMQYYDLAQEAQAKVQRLLEAKCAEPDTPGSVFARLARLYSEQGNNRAALQYYRQALAREYDQIQWRLELAKILVKMGRARQAMSEAKICLQLHPRLDAAEKFVADLSVQPAVVAQEHASP
jgi:tetratricopeptide (TPR) repeat protein